MRFHNLGALDRVGVLSAVALHELGLETAVIIALVPVLISNKTSSAPLRV